MRKLGLLLVLMALCCFADDWCRYEGRIDTRGLVVSFTLKPGVHVYQESLQFAGKGVTADTMRFPMKPDEDNDGTLIYHGTFEVVCLLPEGGRFPDDLTLTFQG